MVTVVTICNNHVANRKCSFLLFFSLTLCQLLLICQLPHLLHLSTHISLTVTLSSCH